MKRKSQNLSNLDKPLGKRNAYNLFFKYHRLLLLQSLSGSSGHHDLASNIDVHYDHWSNHHDLVKDWKSQTVRPCDFPTFEKFMMYVLEIDLGLDDKEEGDSLISDANSSIRRPRTYLKKQKRPHTRNHGLMNLHNMARTIAQIWKEKRTEMEEIFRYFAELDDVRYERDLILYYSLLKVQDKNSDNIIDNNENSNIMHYKRQNQIHKNSFDSTTAASASAYGNLPIFNFDSSHAYASANANANMLPNVSTSSAFVLRQAKVTATATTKKRRVEISPRPTASASSFWHFGWIEPKSVDSFSRSPGPVFSSDEASFLRKMLL